MTSKVLALLEAFSPSGGELTLSDLARRAGVSLSTAHRRAAELVEWGALERCARPPGRRVRGADQRLRAPSHPTVPEPGRARGSYGRIEST
ncbi:helix-turn-helix domain-containing protein [Pseudonocardia xinjiangensis]|uniref:helix-turn-helix domain-containing protein n=1 Tax=Pseudonocardia xinjiangensis TaxID=75289 RepID=UPI003D91F577